LAFVDDITKKFDVTAIGSVDVYEFWYDQRYISSAWLKTETKQDGTVEYSVGKSYDTYPVYRKVTKTVTVTGTSGAVTFGPSESESDEAIALEISDGTATLS
jgi:hypothetical protein